MPVTFEESCNFNATYSGDKLSDTESLYYMRKYCPAAYSFVPQVEVSFNNSGHDIRQVLDAALFFNGHIKFVPQPHKLLRHVLLDNPLMLATFIIAVIAIFCNVICLAVMVRIRMALSGHRLFIMSLCFSDTFICCMYLLVVRSEYLSNQLTSPIDVPILTRDLIVSLLYTAYLLSLFNLIGMAVDHFVGILRPLYYCRWMSTRNITLAIAGIWVVGGLIGCAPHIIIGLISIGKGYSFAKHARLVAMYGSYYYPSMLLVSTPIAFAVIFFSYLRIFKKIGDLHKRSPRLLSQIEIQKATITTLCIVVTFAICWMPWCIYLVYFNIHVRIFDQDQNFNLNDWRTLDAVEKVCMVLLNLNALADPLIYTFRMAQIRSRMAHVLCIEAIRHRLRRGRGSSSSALPNGGAKLTYSAAVGTSQHDAKTRQGQPLPSELCALPVAAIIYNAGVLVPDRAMPSNATSPRNTLTTSLSGSGTASGSYSAPTVGGIVNNNNSRSGSAQGEGIQATERGEESVRLLKNTTPEDDETTDNQK